MKRLLIVFWIAMVILNGGILVAQDDIAFIPVTKNADWTPIERDFDDVTMVLVPVGSFVMGSTPDQIAEGLRLCNSTGTPNHCDPQWFEDEVMNGDNTQMFDMPFWIDQYEVSRAQYQACVDAGICHEAHVYEYSTEPNQPINVISWFDAKEYCEWRGGRLPTEAEWEYAYRGPDGLVYTWGDEFIGDYANHCDENCGNSGWGARSQYINLNHNDGYTNTAPVDAYPQAISWVGAYQMSGNVYEWTSTLFMPYPYQTDDGREADTGMRVDVLRVIRGGSFSNNTSSLRGMSRGWNIPNDAYNGIGVRCARDYSSDSSS